MVFSSNVSSKVNAVDWEYPDIANVREFSLDVKFSSPNLLVVLTVKLLTLAPNNPFLPDSFVSISVVKLSYPIPPLITIALVIDPFVMTGLIIAPVPVPVEITSISGMELYWDPWLVTITSSILPLLITALNSAFLPLCMDISGFTWWLRILEP